MPPLALTSNTRPRPSPSAGKHSKSLVKISLNPLIVLALAILGYLHIQLILQSNAEQGNADLNLGASPVPGTKAKAKTKAKTAADVQQLVDALTRSYSAEDGIASDDRMGFEISLTPTCRCDIVSTDCLHAIACMQDLHNPEQRHAMAWIGIQIRRAIRTTTEFTGWDRNDFWIDIPLGKLLQYSAMTAWTKWRKWNYFPEYNTRIQSGFVQETWYPDCVEDPGHFTKVRYQGVSCLYQSPKDPEESVGTIIEDEANQWYNAAIAKGRDADVTEKKIRKTLESFFKAHQPRHLNPDLRAPANYDAHFSSLGNLVMFAHVTRMLFNRRPFLDKLYQEKLTSVVVPGSKNSSSGAETDNEPYIVAVHMRRGDSCGGPNPRETSPYSYERDATPLYSKAQHGNRRKCYQTFVYLNAVLRIRRLVPETRPLHVYLATDDVSHVIHDIMNKKYTIEEFEKERMAFDDNFYGVDKWHFLNYTRDFFNYTADSIEAEENIANQPFLGESAIADLWLLSHGHAFVGHMGSRFGKVAWLLATARRNDFVPFFSVDGHSEYGFGFVPFCRLPGSVISSIAVCSIIVIIIRFVASFW